MEDDNILIEPFEKEPDEWHKFKVACKRAVAQTTGYFIDGFTEEENTIRFTVWLCLPTTSVECWLMIDKTLIRAMTHEELVQHVIETMEGELEKELNPPSHRPPLSCQPID